LPRLFLVTDVDVVGRPEFVERATAALSAGGKRLVLQLRGHGLKGVRLTELATRLKRVSDETGSQLWVNDRLDVAIAGRLAGVQLGSRSMPPKEARRLLGHSCRIGCSVHGAGEALIRLKQGADVALLGNVFPTASHPGRAALGLAVVTEAAVAGRPIVAIGGMKVDKVQSTIEAGAWGVAVLSGVWHAGDPGAEVRRYLEALEEAVGSSTEQRESAWAKKWTERRSG
jgi:thiamine-phosphate diphosphorylase